MTTKSFRFTDEIATRLKLTARLKKRSESRLVREALDKTLPKLPKLKKQKPRVTAYDLVGHLAGCIKGGPSDMSYNPKYMEGYGS